MPDPTYPALHVRPARGWVNDPNGLCRIDGTWHVFLQHNPDEPVHDHVGWGHLSSPDLLHWTEHSPALSPRDGELDQTGCWSGCVVDDDGVPTAVYTAVRVGPSDGVATLARSDRALVDWTQGTVPVEGIPLDQGADQVRDPFVLDVDGRRYAVQGAGGPGGGARILAYACDDLSDWQPLGDLLTAEDPVAAEVAPALIWECPSLVPVDGRWVLLVSLWRWVDGHHDLAGCAWLVGDLDTTGGRLRFVPERGGRLDEGPAFYAPQALVTDDRVLLYGWSWELDRSEAEVRAAGWAGTLTHPRELRVVDGRLHVVPARELTALRAERLDGPGPDDAGLEGAGPAGDITAAAFEAVSDGPLRLMLVDGDEVREVWTGGSAAGVRLLVDGSLVEAFHDGRTSTTRAYPTGSSHWRVEGATRLWAHRLP